MIDTGAGVIDADYRGAVSVLLFNHSDKDFQGAFFRPRGLLGMEHAFLFQSRKATVSRNSSLKKSKCLKFWMSKYVCE